MFRGNTESNGKPRLVIPLIVGIALLAAVAVVSSKPESVRRMLKLSDAIPLDVSVDITLESPPYPESCTTRANVDLLGNDLVHYSNVGTLEQCQNTCRKNLACKCYTYRASDHNCWLKHGPCDNFGAHNGLQSGLCRGLNRHAMSCSEVTGMDLAGNDLKSVGNIASVDACQNLCRNNLQCSCYTFQASSKTCWVKHGSCNNFSNHPGLTSGICADADCA